MRVSQATDHVTHAIVGGGQAEAFEIDQSAEFFQILSSTLYSDKMLAVVREVMCNAWDAHIDSGRTDKPLKVTLNSSKLIIQDFGFGIPRSLMAQRYAKYGGSTKAKDEKQTGGFGLGCKAPFAYTDHFEVTSCHEHEKTIFQLALSAAEVGGKPSILPIMTIPTTETGLTVSIDLKSRGDFERFDDLVRNISALGEMKVELNGTLLHTIPFSEAKHDFIFVARKFTKNDQLISVRCGNVVYPLAESEEYKREYYNARQLVQNLSGNDYYGGRSDQTWTLVLLAPPGGVSPTPSRESLSLTPTTLKTVKKLLNNFVENFDENTPQSEYLAILSERISKLWLTQSQYQLYSTAAYYPSTEFREETSKLGYLNTRRQLTTARLSRELPASMGFMRRERLQRIDMLIKADVPEKKLLINYRKALVKERAQANGQKRRSHKWRSPWLHQTVIYPVLKALKANSLSIDNFLFFLGEQYRQNDSFKMARISSLSSIEEAFPYLKRLVVLAHSRTHVLERAKHFPEWKAWFASGSSKSQLARCFCYIVPRSKDKPALAKKVLTDLGFHVLDLTEVQPWEHTEFQPSKEPVERKPAAPRKKGIPLLSSIEFDLISMEFQFDKPFSEIPNNKRTMAPETVLNVGRSARGEFGQLSSSNACNIYKLFGDKIGVVNNTLALDKAHKSGAKMFSEWLKELVAAEMLGNADIKLAYTSDPDNGDSSYDLDQLVDAIRDDPELCKHFGLAPHPGERARIFLELWKSFGSYETGRHVTLKLAKDAVDKWSMSPEYLALEKLHGSSKLISLINPLGIKSIMRSGTPVQKNAARQMIIAAFKG